MECRWEHRWGTKGVTLRLMRGADAVPVAEWKKAVPALSHVLQSFTTAAKKPDARHITHEKLATLTDHETVPMGLPRAMDAWVTLRTQGRVDSPRFTVDLRIEPQQYAHAWEVYSRQGARLCVGERDYRLNAHQLALFAAVDALNAAADMPGRLRAYQQVQQASHAPTSARIRVEGYLPRMVLQQGLPAKGFIRANGQLARARAERWAMTPGRRYFLAD